jgi:hypothetical protein
MARAARHRRIGGASEWNAKFGESDMMSETQIHTVARQMLEQLGPGAIAQASQKAQACESHGESNEAKEWRHIADAMRMMRGPHQS